MNESRLADLVTPLREMTDRSDEVLKDYRNRKGVRLVAMTHDLLPQEILAAWDLVALRIPGRYRKEHMFSRAMDDALLPRDVYDFVVYPLAEDYRGGEGFIPFEYPGGFGDEAVPGLTENVHRLLFQAGYPPDRPDTRRLQAMAETYDRMRRLVRGISMNRRNRPYLLSQADMFYMLQAASVLPPELTVDHLQGILDAMNREHGPAVEGMTGALVYATGVMDPALLDSFEEAGLIVAEDDTDDGRRQFDMSINPSSAHAYDEIMECMTYRPLPPPLRSAEERYELLYRMIKNYGIGTVIFIRDWCTPGRAGAIDSLRRRLMRSGVDPLVVESGNAMSVVRGYAERMNL